MLRGDDAPDHQSHVKEKGFSKPTRALLQQAATVSRSERGYSPQSPIHRNNGASQSSVVNSVHHRFEQLAADRYKLLELSLIHAAVGTSLHAIAFAVLAV
jgi:hypothetical protein